MKALVKILHNTEANTFHPIWYSEYPLPGQGNTVTRYKSRGHHTSGFPTAEQSLQESETLAQRLKEQGYQVAREDDLGEWDGKGIPADIQLR